MKKSLWIVLALPVLIQLTTNEAIAQLPIGLAAGARVGSDTENNDILAGGQIEVKVPFITIVPNYEYVFIKDVTNHRINLDLQYTVIGLGIAKLFAGGGYVMSSVKPKGGKSTSESGFNVQVGGKAGFSKLGVFGLARYNKIKDADSFALVAGLNFDLL